MIELILGNFKNDYHTKWDKFIDSSANGTLFHKVAFLSYHGATFVSDLKIIILKNDQDILAGLLYKEDVINESKKCISPFGSSFGGIVLKKDLGLDKTKLYIEQLLNALKLIYNEISLTPAPVIYNKNGEYINWTLLSNDFTIKCADVFNVLDLRCVKDGVMNSLKSKIRNQTKNALKNFEIEEYSKDFKTFYKLLIQDKARLGATATHTEEDLEYLINSLYPDAFIDFATHKETGAKCAIFYLKLSSEVVMTFYMSQANEAKGLNGINALITIGADRSYKNGLLYYDMGSSTFGYNIHKIGLSSFKENFTSKIFLRQNFKWTKP